MCLCQCVLILIITSDCLLYNHWQPKPPLHITTTIYRPPLSSSTRSLITMNHIKIMSSIILFLLSTMSIIFIPSSGPFTYTEPSFSHQLQSSSPKRRNPQMHPISVTPITKVIVVYATIIIAYHSTDQHDPCVHYYNDHYLQRSVITSILNLKFFPILASLPHLVPLANTDSHITGKPSWKELVHWH